MFISDSAMHPPTLSLNVSKSPAILQQLHDTRRGQATDPRDKVWVLMGLLSREDQPLIVPDCK